MSRRPCAGLAELRSAYVDGALDDGDREKLLAHLTGCAECRADVAELRAVRDLLSRGRTEPAFAHDLSDRLVSIAGGAAAEPLWTRPFRRPGPGTVGGLPSRRRTRRVQRTAATAAAVGTLAAAGMIGYVSAPWGQLEVVADPVGKAQHAFSASVGQFPLASDALGAVLLTRQTELTAYPAALGPAPSVAHRSLTGPQALEAMTRAVDSQGAVSYSGRLAYFAARGSETLRADIQVQARTGQGADITVLSQRGVELVNGFSPYAVPSRVVDDELLTLLASHYSLAGVGGATVAGRSATEISAWDEGQRAARWWLDDQTGIVLWQELYDPNTGAVALSFGFTTVSVTPSAEMMPHLSPRLFPETAGTSLSVADVGWLADAGWSCDRQLDGLPLVRLRTDQPADATAVQAVYSDGVATVGVLEQRGRLDGPPAGTAWDPALQAYVHSGASQTATWQTGDTVLTVITDGPADVLARAVASLPAERAANPTTMDRVKEGWVTILAELKG